MKVIVVLLIALLALSPAVFAKANFYQSTQNQFIIKRTTNISGQRVAYPVASTSTFRGLSGIFGASVPPLTTINQSSLIGTFGKPWLKKSASKTWLPPGYTPLGGLANTTPGVSKPICAEFGCNPSQYVVADMGSKMYYRCYCEAAKRIKPENLKCLNTPAVAQHLGLGEGAC